MGKSHASQYANFGSLLKADQKRYNIRPNRKPSLFHPLKELIQCQIELIFQFSQNGIYGQ